MQTLDTTMNIPLVDLKAQYDSIKQEIDAAISAVITQTAFIGGPYVKEFEEAFARYCGVDRCVGVANGTDALFIALKALGVGEGDEVITAANSFIATSEAIKMAGAQVVFVDTPGLHKPVTALGRKVNATAIESVPAISKPPRTIRLLIGCSPQAEVRLKPDPTDDRRWGPPSGGP